MANDPNPDAPGTPSGGSKSIERLLAEKESMRKSVQAGQARIDQLEAELRAAREELTTRSSNATTAGEMTRQDIDRSVREAVREEWDARERAQAQQLSQQRAFEAQVLDWRKKAFDEIPGAKDQASAVSRRAKAIFDDPANGLAERGYPTRPDAEYSAYLRAEKELAVEQAANATAASGAAFAATGAREAGGGMTGTPAELSDEDFLKLSPQERARYQAQQAGFS